MRRVWVPRFVVSSLQCSSIGSVKRSKTPAQYQRPKLLKMRTKDVTVSAASVR